MEHSKRSTRSSATSESNFDRTRTRDQGTAASARDARTRDETTERNRASRSTSSKRASRGSATIADGETEHSRQLIPAHVKALEKRGLDSETCGQLGLYTQSRDGSVGERYEGALVFPFVREGKEVNHKYRLPGKQFMQDKGAPRAFFNEDCLRDPTLAHLPVIITEGEFDAIAAIQSGHPRTVSVPDGANSNLDFFTDIWPLLESVPRFILAGDGDEKGAQLNEELARRLGAARCAWVDYPCGKDLNAKEEGSEAVSAAIENAKPYPIKGLFKLSDYPPDPNFQTFATGWKCLDDYLKLWLEEFVVITGIPQHGKSTWALHLAAQLAQVHSLHSVIASFEMRVNPHVANVFRKYHGGTQREADRWINDHFTFIDQDPSCDDRMDISWVIDKASDAVIRYGVRWLWIDPWNQIQHRRDKGESTVEYQERAIFELKQFGRRFGCGVGVIVHPTKDVKDHRSGKVRVPGLYDIDGSAHWYNAADHGIVIDRPDLGSNLIGVHVKKSRYREGGVCGVGALRYDFRVNRFVEAEAGALDSHIQKDGK
jgi:twinkle protein